MAAEESTTIPFACGATPDERPRTDESTQTDVDTNAHSSSALRCRRLKVGYAYTDPEKNLPYRPVPHLRLAGRWLKDAGFTIGQYVKIEVHEGRLTIEPVA